MRGTTSRRLLHIALATLVLRALVPVGMMAAPVADGWLFKLCPSGMSMPSYMALLNEKVNEESSPVDHSAHAGHPALSENSEHAEHTQGDTDPVCGLSAGFAALGIAFELFPALATASLEFSLTEYAHLAARAPPRANLTRAPPILS